MSKKVVIRVNNPKPFDEMAKMSAPQVVVYHWDRIVGAVFVFLVLAGIVTWGGSRLFGTPAETSVAADQSVAVGASGAALPDAVPQSQQIARRPEANRDQATTAKGIRDHHSRVVEEPADRKNSSGDGVAETHGKAVSSGAGVSILSRNVKRAQFTSNVVGDEPIDDLGSVIPMNQRGLIKVYLFMETSGLDGKALYHDWYWKGKRMAHTRIPIRPKHGNTASSKFIDRIMVGDWEVRVVDDKATVLVKAAFQVR